MPISAIDQNKILTGAIGPDNIKFQTLVINIAVITGVDFIVNYKTSAFEEDSGTSEALFPDARSYVNKLRGVSRNAIKADSDQLKQLFRTIVALVGEDFTIAQVQNASDQQWETHITARMIRCFEVLGNVSEAERSEYNDRPANQV